MDARRFLLRYSLTLAGATVGGIGLGLLVVAAIGKKLWDSTGL